MFNLTSIYMVKLGGPCHSLSASGKLADAIVFFGWKGIAVARQWVVPHNKKSATQGNRRTMIGGIGKAAGKVRPSSSYAKQLIDLSLVPGGQSKQSFLVKYVLDHYLMTPSAFVTQLAEFTAATMSANYETAAGLLGVVNFSLTYDTIADFDKGMGLYLLAKAAHDLLFTGTPYTTAIASWVTADVNGMISDFTDAV